MRLKKIACTILSFVCMFFLGLGIFMQQPIEAKAESPTVTVAINQGANNVDWDATQKKSCAEHCGHGNRGICARC